MAGKRSRVAVASCLSFLALCGSATAQPTWLAPLDVSAPDGNVSAVAGTMAPDGTVWSAWKTNNANGDGVLQLAQRAPGGTVQKLEAVTSGGAPDDPSLAIASDGALVIGWLDLDTNTGDTLVRFERRGGGAVTLAREEASDLDVAAGPGGVVVAAWSAGGEGAGEIHVRVSRDNGATFGPVRTLSTDNDATDPSVAVAGDGTILVAWARLDVAGAGRIRLATIAPNDAASPGVLVSPAGDDAGEPSVVSSPSLGTVVAWTAIDAAENGSVKIDVPGDAVPPAQVPSPGDQSAPDLAVDASGTLWVAWAAETASVNELYVATRDALAFGPTTKVSGGDQVDLPRLAFDGAGNGVMVWRKPVNPDVPEAGGDARAAGFDGAPPTITTFGAPAQAVAGVPAAFSVRATDVWSAIQPPAWDFGDGATATGEDVQHTYAEAGSRTASVTVTDAVGNAASQSGHVEVSPAGTQLPPAPAPSPTSAPSRAAIRVDGFSATFSCVRYGGRVTGRPSFGFTLSEAATVTLHLRRRTPSPVRRTCPRDRPKGAAGTYTPALSVQGAGGPGATTVGFGPDGELLPAGAASVRKRVAAVVRTRLRGGRRHLSIAQLAGGAALQPGTYIATVTARTADGRVATTGHLKFWILTPTSHGR